MITIKNMLEEIEQDLLVREGDEREALEKALLGPSRIHKIAHYGAILNPEEELYKRIQDFCVGKNIYGGLYSKTS